MTRMRTVAALIAILCAVGGCTLSRVRLGQPVTAEQAARIEEGSSKAAILDLLGPPDQVAVEARGTVFEYLYRQQSGRELEITVFRASFTYQEAYSHADRLVIRFDQDGRVREYGIVTAAGTD